MAGLRVDVKDLAPWRRELTIEVSPESAAERRLRIFEAFRSKAKIPGFRPGKAPMSLVQKTYGAALEEEFVDRVVEDAVREALEESRLEPMDSPSVRDLSAYEPGQPLRMTATVDVVPRIEVRGHQGIAVERVLYDVEEADVDAFLEEIRDRAATFEKIEDRGAGRGDFVAIRYQELDPDRKPAAGSKERETVVEIGEQGLLPEFENGLLGAKPGEQRPVTVSYPPDYTEQKLRGRIVTFRVDVLDLRRRVIPPLDAELARKVSGLETLDEFRAKAREELSAREAAAADRRAEEAVVERILEMNPFDPPELWVERGLEGIVSEFRQDRPEMTDEEVKRLRGGVRAEVVRRLRRDMAIEAVGHQEKIEVSGDELRQGVARLAERSGRDVKETAGELAESGRLRRLAEGLFERKVLERLVSVSQVTTVNRPRPRDPQAPGRIIKP
jgi:trigger factor